MFMRYLGGGVGHLGSPHQTPRPYPAVDAEGEDFELKEDKGSNGGILSDQESEDSDTDGSSDDEMSDWGGADDDMNYEP
jgi:hypothetical protein